MSVLHRKHRKQHHKQVCSQTPLDDYFPAVLSQEINSAAYIIPMLTGDQNQPVVLKGTGEVVLLKVIPVLFSIQPTSFRFSFVPQTASVRNDKFDVKVSQLYTVPVCYITNQSKYFISLDAKVMIIDGDRIKEVPELKDEDIIQIVTVPYVADLFLTVQGEVLSMLGQKAHRLKLKHPAVQLCVGLTCNILDNQGKVYRVMDTHRVGSYLFPRPIVKMFDDDYFLTSEGNCCNNKGEITDEFKLKGVLDIDKVKERLFWLGKDGIFADRGVILATDIICFKVYNHNLVTLSKTYLLTVLSLDNTVLGTYQL